MGGARFTVHADSEGMTLGAFLEEKLQLSGRKAKALLDERCVFVNGRRVWMARHPLRAGDSIEVARRPNPAAPAAAPRVLLERPDLLVLDKPPGLLANGERSAEAWARLHFRDASIAAVHRLDRDTSGCLLLARGREHEEILTRLFLERLVEKSYEAIAHGQLATKSVTIRAPIDHRPAVTHLTVLDEGALASHLRIAIETGRTHQIRKHLAGIRHAVVGDPVYGPKREPNVTLRSAPRQMLHATELRFRDPQTQELLSARAPLPDDFRAMLRRLGLR